MMFLSPKLFRHPQLKVGMLELAPQAPGVAAWGLMTGVAMVKSGMSVFESLAMTLLVFAGSSQLASIPLIVAGAPAWVILATGHTYTELVGADDCACCFVMCGIFCRSFPQLDDVCT